jgi:hypothetical protein
MRRALVLRHPDLFEDGDPLVVVPCDQKQQLVRLIQVMLIECLTTTSASAAKQEDGDDEDHA